MRWLGDRESENVEDQRGGGASSVGDDHLQRQTRGTVMPDAFTHGSSAQRVHWFKRGLESGNTKQCDTFAANEP